ncbi:uncharacterized protein A4U43_C07F24240 [Asparagus officinalis]|uniref:Uncharacterized protein n=1 Tax=Asparagus officinalis TaxID=4686 RepID=A0A5P1EHH7_ASPOF|nr:uncharacterized protein A4U43_C07F24240 [Asparagus officinalis]
MEQIWTKYHKLLKEVTSLRAERGVGSKQATKASAPSAPEVDRLRQELEESQRKDERIKEVVRESGRVEVRADMEKDVAVHTRRRLDEEHAMLVKLQEEAKALAGHQDKLMLGQLRSHSSSSRSS